MSASGQLGERLVARQLLALRKELRAELKRQRNGGAIKALDSGAKGSVQRALFAGLNDPYAWADPIDPLRTRLLRILRQLTEVLLRADKLRMEVGPKYDDNEGTEALAVPNRRRGRQSTEASFVAMLPDAFDAAGGLRLAGIRAYLRNRGKRLQPHQVKKAVDAVLQEQSDTRLVIGEAVAWLLDDLPSLFQRRAPPEATRPGATRDQWVLDLAVGRVRRHPGFQGVTGNVSEAVRTAAIRIEVRRLLRQAGVMSAVSGN